jgi:hypothetical protein
MCGTGYNVTWPPPGCAVGRLPCMRCIRAIIACFFRMASFRRFST